MGGKAVYGSRWSSAETAITNTHSEHFPYTINSDTWSTLLMRLPGICITWSSAAATCFESRFYRWKNVQSVACTNNQLCVCRARMQMSTSGFCRDDSGWYKVRAWCKNDKNSADKQTLNYVYAGLWFWPLHLKLLDLNPQTSKPVSGRWQKGGTMAKYGRFVSFECWGVEIVK